MKIKFMLFGIMMALALCITPVAAVSADDFEVDVEEGYYYKTYTYTYVDKPKEKYIEIITDGTYGMYSYVTFKPINIKNASVMVVDTGNTDKLITIYLPRSVDEWEIKYYSNSKPLLKPDRDYLKNAGTVNLNKFFKNQIQNGDGLYLELSWNQHIHSVKSFDPCYYIPEV